MDRELSSMVETCRSRVGSTVRRKYRLDALLGVGGMGAVFAATHRNGSRVALKILHPELAKMEDVKTRFLREGYVANRIAHPGVVRVLDDDDDDDLGTVFLVVELLEGENLDERAKRHLGKLPLSEVLDVAEKALEILAAAHAASVVHRDVKPENLFLTRGGELKVLDFGIARLADGGGTTRTGNILGTPAFMAPEQASGRVREVDARTDLWALGATIFTLVAGRHVHPGGGAQQMLYAATNAAPRIESVAPEMPVAVAAVVNRALFFDRDARWPDAKSMLQGLRFTRALPAALPPPGSVRTAVHGGSEPPPRK